MSYSFFPLGKALVIGIFAGLCSVKRRAYV